MGLTEIVSGLRVMVDVDILIWIRYFMASVFLIIMDGLVCRLLSGCMGYGELGMGKILV